MRTISYSPAIFRCFVLTSSLCPPGLLLVSSAFLSLTPPLSFPTHILYHLYILLLHEFSNPKQRVIYSCQMVITVPNRELICISDYHLIGVFTTDQRMLWNLISLEIESFRGFILELRTEKCKQRLPRYPLPPTNGFMF